MYDKNVAEQKVDLNGEIPERVIYNAGSPRHWGQRTTTNKNVSNVEDKKH